MGRQGGKKQISSLRIIFLFQGWGQGGLCRVVLGSSIGQSLEVKLCPFFHCAPAVRYKRPYQDIININNISINSKNLFTQAQNIFLRLLTSTFPANNVFTERAWTAGSPYSLSLSPSCPAFQYSQGAHGQIWSWERHMLPLPFLGLPFEAKWVFFLRYISFFFSFTF